MKPDWQLARDTFGKLALTTADGVIHEGVTPVRAFALSAPGDGIALLSAEGKELLWLPQLTAAPAAAQSLLAEELAQRDFMPVIQRIRTISSFATPSTWQIDTDRGATELILKSEDDIRRLQGPGALLVADSNGIHYLIRDRRALDATSQRILKRFL